MHGEKAGIRQACSPCPEPPFIVCQPLERYIGGMTDIHSLDRDDAVIGRHGAIKLHGPEGFAGMRAAGRVAAEILDALIPHVVPGVTTER